MFAVKMPLLTTKGKISDAFSEFKVDDLNYVIP